MLRDKKKAVIWEIGKQQKRCGRIAADWRKNEKGVSDDFMCMHVIYNACRLWGYSRGKGGGGNTEPGARINTGPGKSVRK